MKILIALVACCLLTACQSAPVPPIPTKPPVAQATPTVSPFPSDFQHKRLASLFHSDTNCTAPCWRNVRPGRTTKADIQELMKTLPNEDIQEWTKKLPNSAKDEPCYMFGNNIERCILRDNTFELGIVIELNNGVVDYLRFSSTARAVPILPLNGVPVPTATFDPQRPNFDSAGISLKDIFATTGEPGEYSARIHPGLHGDDFLMLTLFYQEGVVIEGTYFDLLNSTSSSDCQIDIPVELPVGSILFTPLTELKQATDSNAVLNLLREDDVVSDWHGTNDMTLTVCNKWPR